MELAIVLIIALIVFGPKRLPELGRSLGKGIREFRGSVSGETRESERTEAIEPPKQEADDEGVDDTASAEGETVAHERR